jgi:calcineurin-like phosphoesterase family protein
VTLLVTADLHFNHRGILTHCPISRPFSDHLEMNEDIIRVWNETVDPSDEVVVLGDFGFKVRDGQPLDEIFTQLHGHKRLVVGNHDEQNKTVLGLPWEQTYNLVTLRQGDRGAVACHYPLVTWKHAHRGYLMLHGHSHGTLKQTDPRRFDVGWDCFLRPVPFETFFDLAGPFSPQDHHGA